MSERYKPRKLGPVDGLVVVSVCLFLLAGVMPASRKARVDSTRITCARNLAELGRAMLVYANDYDGELPRAGGRSSVWSGRIPNWMAENRFFAYGASPDGSGGVATITSSLYLLIKYAGVQPKSFVCPGDAGTTEFNHADDGAGNIELADLWDFGRVPYEHCSYSYHMPYGLYPLTTSSEPGMAVAADRNPWIGSPAVEAKDGLLIGYKFNPDGGREAVKIGNAIAHEEEGQNVLFLDGHVSFEDRPFCGVNNDNIYTFWAGGDIRRGGVPLPGACEPVDRLDSFLVHDPPADRRTYTRTTTTKQPEAIDSADLKQTSVVATLDCPVPEHRNIIWCSTFQMAWDKLKNDIIGEPIKVPGTEELASRLNQAKVYEADIEKESLYIAAGLAGKGIIKQIQKEMKKRFPSAPVPVFDKPKRSPDSAVTFSYSNIDMEYKYPFYAENSPFIFEDVEGTQTKVTSFCNNADELGDSNEKHVHEQVDILYYKRDNKLEPTEFVIDLCKYTSPYQVVLALVSRRNTLRETLDAVEQKTSEFKENPDYEVLRKPRTFGFGDIIIVPDILFKLTHQFAELKDRPLGNSQLPNCSFSEAKQIIDFSLGKTSVIFKSGVTSFLWPLAQPPPKPRRLCFNKPFLIYVKKRQEGTNPFFVMWVDNAELMKKF